VIFDPQTHVENDDDNPPVEKSAGDEHDVATSPAAEAESPRQQPVK